METADLIRSLATNAPRVKRLRPPLVRATGWLLIAAAIMGLMTISHGVRPQFADRMQDTVFAVNMISSLMTGVLATIATFFVSLPDRSRRWLLLPAPPLLVWLSTIGYQCFAGWVPVPPGGDHGRGSIQLPGHACPDQSASIAADAGNASLCGGAPAHFGHPDGEPGGFRHHRDRPIDVSPPRCHGNDPRLEPGHGRVIPRRSSGIQPEGVDGGEGCSTGRSCSIDRPL